MSYLVTLSTTRGGFTRRFPTSRVATGFAYCAVLSNEAKTASVTPLRSLFMRWGTQRVTRIRFYWRRKGTDLRVKATVG